MSKETAHQLGTPISSLMGWMELLKQSDLDPSMIREMQKDTDRLRKSPTAFPKSVPDQLSRIQTCLEF